MREQDFDGKDELRADTVKPEALSETTAASVCELHDVFDDNKLLSAPPLKSKQAETVCSIGSAG